MHLQLVIDSRISVILNGSQTTNHQKMAPEHETNKPNQISRSLTDAFEVILIQSFTQTVMAAQQQWS